MIKNDAMRKLLADKVRLWMARVPEAGTQAKLAVRAKMSQSSIHRILMLGTEPELATAYKMASAFGITVSLRLRLRGVDDNRLSMEMFELLIEWMQEKRDGDSHALDALHALNARFGLVAEHIEERDDNDQADTGLTQLVSTALHLQAHVGHVAGEVQRAIEDARIDEREAEQIIATGRKGQRLFQRLMRTARDLAARRRR